MIFTANGRGALWICASGTKKLRFSAFFRGIVCFCTINGSFRMLKKPGGNISFF